MEKKRLINSLIFCCLIIAFIGLVSAIPGIPHQFYGNIEVNEKPASGNILVGKVGVSQEYITISNKNGVYGIKPNTFFIEDPKGDNTGKTINFYVGGKLAGTYIFQSNALTKLDFSLTTECGDDYCLGKETCSNCEIDCGLCTEPPQIFIESPKNEIYNTSKIDVDVYSDQKIILWKYSLNSGEETVFTPNITLTLGKGNYNLNIIGVNNAYQSNSKKISFEVDVPGYCGDSMCSPELDETCSSCYIDCGYCPSSSGNPSSGSSGRITSFLKKLIPLSSENNTETPEEEKLDIKISDESPSDEHTNQETQNKGFFSGITGFVISTGENFGWINIIIIIFIVCLLIFLFVFVRRKSRKRKEISEYH